MILAAIKINMLLLTHLSLLYFQLKKEVHTYKIYATFGRGSYKYG
jgi:hypothetical protein